MKHPWAISGKYILMEHQQCVDTLSIVSSSSTLGQLNQTLKTKYD